jgi:tetratricopeptide (TPR) repeat protein
VNRRAPSSLLILLALCITGAGVGCAASRAERQASRAVSAYFAGKPDLAVKLLEPLAEEPDRNYVLNNLRLGQAALAAGDLNTAEAAYYRAYETLNAAGVNNPARTAATVLFNESVRIWLGEPYERAIANFQLGVVYYLQNDYANARGAFENALFKLRRYADDQDQERNFREQESTFAVAYIMLGRSWQRLGREDLAADAFARARELDSSLAALTDPELHARSNVLLILEWGSGPQKLAQGSGLVFATSRSPLLPVPRVTVNGEAVALADVAVPTIDTHVMARQRPWQTTDTYRAIREVTGTGMMIGGVVVLDQGLRKKNEDAALVGAGLIGLGALLSASSRPDVRQWEMVPRTIYLVPLELPPGTHDISVSLPDDYGYGNLVHEFRGVLVQDGRETALYAPIQGGLAGVTDYGAPPP